MLLRILTLLLVFASLQVKAQEHDRKRPQCVYYLYAGKKGGATPDGYAACGACDKIRFEKYEQERLKAVAENKKREEKIAREVAQQKAKEQAEKQQQAQRNATALAEINDINRQSEELDRLRREEAARKRAVDEKYNSQLEKANRDFNEHLSKLQAAAKTEIPPSDDAFWNETVSPANYLPFQDQRTKMWGFKNKQGSTKISPQYHYASNFSNGIAYVEKADKSTMIINAKGEVITTLTVENLRSQFRGRGYKLGSIFRPDTLSGGLLIMAFYLEENNTYVKRYGCLDRKGNLVVPPTFHKIEAFVNGLAKASKFIKETDESFETGSYYFSSKFTYLEEGLIRANGQWSTTPRKKLLYTYGSSAKGYLVVTDSSWDKLSRAEKDAIEARTKLKKKQERAEGERKLESKVNSVLSSARSQGYSIEKIK